MGHPNVIPRAQTFSAHQVPPRVAKWSWYLAPDPRSPSLFETPVEARASLSHKSQQKPHN